MKSHLAGLIILLGVVFLLWMIVYLFTFKQVAMFLGVVFVSVCVISYGLTMLYEGDE